MIGTINSFKTKKVLGNILHIIDVEEFSPDLVAYINEHFVSICEGASESDIDTVKKRVINFLYKKDDRTKMGAIAEFFVHLYLKSLGYKQECTYFNLEEGSIKKGFDGYYSKNNTEWIMESKSGSINTHGITHVNKISVAYKDLVDKFNGDVSNNPWRNAYNHASNRDVATSNDIRQNIRKLSDDFTNQIFPSIKDFNIIPVSTIFLDGIWMTFDESDLQTKLSKALKSYEYKNIMIICVTKKTIDLFSNYLNS